jgi:hypothetical protein
MQFRRKNIVERTQMRSKRRSWEGRTHLRRKYIVERLKLRKCALEMTEFISKKVLPPIRNKCQ